MKHIIQGKRKIVCLLVAVMLMTLIPVQAFAATSIVSTTDTKYTYGDINKDIPQLAKKYPDILKAVVLGKTADNRKLWCLYLGNPDAKKQIFVTAGMHAREYINSQVTMEMVEYYCKKYNTASYNGVPYSELFDKVCICIVPMVNPDGISISAFGPSSIRDEKLRAKIIKMPRVGAYSNWQSNARGVDLNRNYKMYSTWPSQKTYSSWGYPGPSRYSEAETQAVMAAMDSCSSIKGVINYHSMGQVIYWGYHNQSYKSKCYSFVKLFKSMTGYSLINESNTSATYGDFEHYIMHEYKVPYVCIENGTGGVPVAHSQLSSIYSKNRLGFAKAAYKYY